MFSLNMLGGLKRCRVCSNGKYRVGKRRSFQVVSMKILEKRHAVDLRHTEKEENN